MWSPTHIKVTIRSARNLLCKGKNNTNNCFVTIGLGKEKYQTSVKEKAETNVAWNEECELKIPDQGNRAELVLTCLHRNNLGIDEFLGQVTLPLNEMDAYDRPRAKWHKLESKPGKEKKNKERGELDVLISFTVKSGSLTDLSKKEKHKSSIGQLASSVGGSLMSIRAIEKRKGITKGIKKIGSKLHISGSGKKKNKDDDDMSYTGSFASIGTPNRARVPDSDDEDDFQFDKLSQKSSVSSLNIRDGLQPPSQNYMQRNPSPLMGSTGKGQIGKDHHFRYDGSDNLSVDPELEEIENEFSIRARTLPPPSKPPRTPQMDGGEVKTNGKELDEWEKKLYGRSADTVNSDSIKRRSWEPVALPLKSTNGEYVEETEKEKSLTDTEAVSKPVLPTLQESHTPESFSDTSSSNGDEVEVEKPKQVVAPLRQQKEETSKESVNSPSRPTDLKFLASTDNNEIIKKVSLISPDVDKNEFAKFNASFAKFEQRNSSKFFDIGEETNNFLKKESLASGIPQPQPKPRARVAPSKEKEENSQDVENEKRQRAAEDARLEAELHENEKRLREEEEALQKELRQREEEKRREAKRREEDFRILNFSKRLAVSQEDKSEEKEKEKQEKVIEPLINNKEQHDQEEKKPEINNKKERQFNFNREKQMVNNASTPSPKENERIIIGHEKSTTQAERRAEISAALAKKYEGKSREELMLIANGMENEALIQRQRVKELEDYLDNLLLRVMETHPKILQNPYSRTTSAKRPRHIESVVRYTLLFSTDIKVSAEDVDTMSTLLTDIKSASFD